MSGPRPILALDLGNTSLKIAKVSGDHVIPLARLERIDLDSGIALPELPDLPCFVSCVVPALRDALRVALEARGRRPRFVGIDVPLPLRLDYSTPETLGSDRVLAAFAAFVEMGTSVIVVQAGTAITVDGVSPDGVFVGGAIALGVMGLRRAQSLTLPALPAPEVNATVTWPAKSTQAAVDLGLKTAVRGLVRELLQDARDSMPKGTPILLSGGDALVLRSFLPEFVWKIDQDLVLKGLSKLDHVSSRRIS